MKKILSNVWRFKINEQLRTSVSLISKTSPPRLVQNFRTGIYLQNFGIPGARSEFSNLTVYVLELSGPFNFKQSSSSPKESWNKEPFALLSLVLSISYLLEIEDNKAAKHAHKGQITESKYGENVRISIHLIPKWRPINYSFVCMLISHLCFVNMYKTKKNFEVKMRQWGLNNMQTKE